MPPGSRPRSPEASGNRGSSAYVLGEEIVLGPGTLSRATLVHEFSHLLGFRDNYFRSFEDAGAGGYRILEVILSPEDVLVVQEIRRVRRGHFEEVVATSR